jgi:SAM-dependent MidA family methyltransferase
MPAPSAPASSAPEGALAALIAAEIAAGGPISVARFMALALGHAEHGYYRAGQPLGAAGDFVTAPEISQMFGELLGLWLAQAWLDRGRPRRLRLVELGPGRGRLMADLLRAAASVAGFLEALDLHLVEQSAPLRAAQAAALAGRQACWHEDLASVPPGSSFVLANEFFDALPVVQLVRTGQGWVERLVGLDPAGGFAFRLADAPSPLAEAIAGGAVAPAGTIAELSPARAALAQALGARVARGGGLALIVDYGAWAERPTGDTLQAVRGHRRAPPLADPGRADLSAQVDFRPLAAAAAGAGAAVYGPIPQGAFLRAFGIELRAARLLQRAGPDEAQTLRAALFRLTDASAMGELFKVLILADPAGPAPPGCLAPTLPPAVAP